MMELIKKIFTSKFITLTGVLLLAAIFIFPYSTEISGFWISPAGILIALLFLAALVFIFANKNKNVIGAINVLMLASLMAVYFASTFISSKSILVALKAAQPIFIGIALVMAISLFEIKNIRILAWTAAILVGLSSILGVIQFYSASLSFYPAYYLGYGKTLYYAAGFANLTTFHALGIIAFLPVLIVLFLAESNKKLKYILQFVISFAILNLFFTFSRGAWLAALLTLGALFFVNRGRYREFLKLGITAAVLILAVLFIPYLNQEGKNHTFVGELFLSQFDLNYQFSTRLIAAKTTSQILISKPLVGTGLNKFADYWAKVTPSLAFNFDRNLHSEPLNTFFEVLVSGGIIGLIIFLIILYVAFKNYFISWQMDNNFWAFGFMLGLAAILIDGLFHTFTYSKLLWLFMGLSFAFVDKNKNNETDLHC